MQYWGDMNDKYGFNDGQAIPAEAEIARKVYVTALNAVAANKGSKVRAIAWDRPGVHNGCLIVMVALTFFNTLSPGQVAGEVPVNLPDVREPNDKAWRETVADCIDIGLDDYVVTTTVIAPEFAGFLESIR